MTARFVSRATFLTGLIGLGAFVAAPEALAARNADAETYVQQNATAALTALGNTSVSSSQRTQQFHRLMVQFADTEYIARYVLGRYDAALRADPALRRDWFAAFQDFAIATYEDRFENMSGATVQVRSSEESTPGRVVIVESRVAAQGREPLRVQWKVVRSNNAWRVRDVAVGPDGVWLGQFQQRQFLAELDRNRGDVRALIADIRTRTASMRQRILARS